MRQKKFLVRFSAAIGATILAATIFAQSSPWPFPPRGGSTPKPSSPWPFPPRTTGTPQATPAARAPTVPTPQTSWPFTQGGSTTAQTAAGTLTVAFWNIEWFPGGRPNASQSEQMRQISAVQADMVQLKADILGLGEVNDFASTGLAVQKLPGFKADVCANFPAREGQKETQQVAIASRLQPLSAWAEMWKPGPTTPPRGFAFAAYEPMPGQLLLVYAVHFKSNQGNIKANIAMRQESVRQLHSHMADMEKAYSKLGTIAWIVGGDFNTSLDDARFAEETTLRNLIERGFLWTWQNVPVAARTTLPPSKQFPPACFDHIFYRGLKLRRAWVAATTPQSSDHRAAVATFDLSAAGR